MYIKTTDRRKLTYPEELSLMLTMDFSIVFNQQVEDQDLHRTRDSMIECGFNESLRYRQVENRLVNTLKLNHNKIGYDTVYRLIGLWVSGQLKKLSDDVEKSKHDKDIKEEKIEEIKEDPKETYKKMSRYVT
jgi:hypothetical protein